MMTRNEQTSAPRVLCIVGPTASGKTALAVAAAKALNGEVISCDSMQIYKYLSIGTAKPTPEEMDGVVHHCIDFVDPRTPFSCPDYVAAATACAHDILSRGKLPVFCGGTGLYLDSTIRGTRFSDKPDDGDSAVLADLQAEFERDGIDGIYARLTEADPEAAAAIHKNNTKRVLRALEIYLTTGKTKTEWDAASHTEPPVFDACYIGLDYRDRSVLHDRINRRVTLMLENGLEEEVRRLYAEGYLPDASTAAQAIGYKEFLAYLRGEMSLDEASDTLRTATRRYAKRQLTWFRRNPDMHWLYPDEIVKTLPADTDLLSVLCRRTAEIFSSDVPKGKE
ncbi:MAG: tRNA (adenosine(37)-N6)-dimethylallyltransferase MiaA [Clostridia bacterium]|nr:tRNA (adenosine(37)-N6)-dimethylallyltransferase MiaA [Clostridia bacterium]